jgi:hypothetical protein
MTHHHSNLRVRFYPTHGEWTCIVQRLGADGMPEGADVVSAVGATKAEARDNAVAKATDADVQDALKACNAS